MVLFSCETIWMVSIFMSRDLPGDIVGFIFMLYRLGELHFKGLIMRHAGFSFHARPLGCFSFPCQRTYIRGYIRRRE